MIVWAKGCIPETMPQTRGKEQAELLVLLALGVSLCEGAQGDLPARWLQGPWRSRHPTAIRVSGLQTPAVKNNSKCPLRGVPCVFLPGYFLFPLWKWVAFRPVVKAIVSQENTEMPPFLPLYPSARLFCFNYRGSNKALAAVPQK